MESRGRAAFAILIAAQAAHAIEEYVFRLFDVWGPSRFISGLFSRDLATGFALANTAIVLLGLACYLGPVRSRNPLGLPIAWCWAGVEFANGLFHIVLAVAHRGYFPGLATAPLLLGASQYLATRLISQSARPQGLDARSPDRESRRE